MIEILRESQDLGFIGPGDVHEHVLHAARFFDGLSDLPAPFRALDLGSGGGLPGLVLASHFSKSSWSFLDVGQRRCEFLREAVAYLGLVNASILEGRAEDLARDPALRQQFDVVVARSFGIPAVTAECATGFVKAGGQLHVSEPPDSPNRWPEESLAQLGLELAYANQVAVMVQTEPSGKKWPRRNGQPAKRPLF